MRVRRWSTGSRDLEGLWLGRVDWRKGRRPKVLEGGSLGLEGHKRGRKQRRPMTVGLHLD